MDKIAVKPELLKRFSLFENLGATDLEFLCSHSQLQRYARRSVLLQPGSSDNVVCLVFEGRLQGIDFTIDGKEVGLYFVEANDYCGELGVFDAAFQPEHVIALKPSVVVLVRAEALREVAKRSPEIILQLGNKLARRVKQMTAQRSLLSVPNVTQRVCNQLWQLLPGQQADEITIEIHNLPTHMEIAIMLNLSRETITRVFQQLQRKQIVSRTGPNSLIIKHTSLLKKIADGSEKL
ncbi:Crp/Fnr family transcriptional regulator [Gammaproteobacteria bacterium]|nr:Crp/Fnr family transcriptional regulator [Gammaproteobacteria bacterium]